ncbi:unnamed protein product, partial [Mesorhabditis belari]|uniref:ShKT domain-containing protein n=1 Tax=Mesorhabditis belari TaxID=2138241 RepID=A0AAF3FA15_9BILA
MESTLFSLIAIFALVQISGQNCPAFAPNVATSSLKSTGTGPPSSGTTCPNGGICFALNGVDSCYVCADASSSCSNWNTNGLCSSTFYTTQYKRSYCPKTCGFC